MSSFFSSPFARYGVHRSAVLMEREICHAAFRSSVLKISLNTLKKITMPTELMSAIGIMTILTMSIASTNGLVSRRIITMWINSEINVIPRRK